MKKIAKDSLDRHMGDLVFSNNFLTDIEIIVYDFNRKTLEKTVYERFNWFFFPNTLVKRWKWYFNYRAALLQVQYPRAIVEVNNTTSDMKSPQQQKEILRNRIIAKKRKITIIDNQMQKLRENQGLFSIEEDPRYPATMAKIQEQKNQLEEMEKKLLTYINT